MMPTALNSITSVPVSRFKIGFSIDSIVGSNKNNDNGSLHRPPIYFSPNSECSERPSSPLSNDCYNPNDFNYARNYYNSKTSPNSEINRALRLINCSPNELQNRINRLQQQHHNQREGIEHPDSPPPPSHHLQTSPFNHQRSNLLNNNTDSISANLSLSDRKSPLETRLSPENRGRSPTPPPPPQSHQLGKSPIVLPGIPAGLVRPFPVAPPSLADMKPLPPYLSPSDMVQQHHPHFLAAQFQMAAALAHQNGGFPPQHPVHAMSNPNMPRESYPLYPWLLSRHGRIFPYRFPGNFLLQPFRKPKRIRTAFSPSQLLKLEHAFENNHYVVGAERKALAKSLSLSETQVKVWFQNRRTKHKRVQQEDDQKSGGQSRNFSCENDGNLSYDEDELIDMEMDDVCPSDEEEVHLQ